MTSSKAAHDDRPAVIQFTLPMGKKASYVKAAHAKGMKLVPWMLEQLDEAVKREEKSALSPRTRG